MIIPPSLSPGDRVMIISPSGKIENAFIAGAETYLRDWGLNPVRSRHCLCESGRFSGTMEERLADLRDALLDDSVKAILCSRGGYGAIQLLEKMNSSWVTDHPKWLIGYSDITLLHAYFSKCGICSIHGPMTRHFCEAMPDDEPVMQLKDLLFGGKPHITASSHPLNREGRCRGRIFGGNLSVLYGLRGTPFDIEPEGTVLFLEDIGERPYHLERMFYNLRLGGILSRLSGLIIGQFTEYSEDQSLGETVYEMIARMVNDYDYPVCFDFPVGHVQSNFPLIVGKDAGLIVEKGGVTLR